MEKQKGSDPDKTYPYMLDGMTMFLASGDKGKSKAARKARDAAYTMNNQNNKEDAERASSLKIKNMEIDDKKLIAIQIIL